MGYEIVWNPIKKVWAIYSTVVDDYLESNLKTPDDVAKAIVGKDQHYFCNDHICKAEFKTREEIINHYTNQINNAKDSCFTVIENATKDIICHTKKEIQFRAKELLQRDLLRWDNGEICPKPEATQQLIEKWKHEAERVKRENITAIETALAFSLSEKGDIKSIDRKKGFHFPP